MQKGFTNIVVIIAILTVVGATSYFVITKQTPFSYPSRSSDTSPLSPISSPTSNILPPSSDAPAPSPTPLSTTIKGTISPAGFYPIIIGKAYGFKLTALGFGNDKPLKWEITSGSLPPGLALELSGSRSVIECGAYGSGTKGGGILTYADVLICGTPGKTGSFPFTLRATLIGDSGEQGSAERAYTLTVKAQ